MLQICNFKRGYSYAACTLFVRMYLYWDSSDLTRRAWNSVAKCSHQMKGGGSLSTVHANVFTVADPGVCLPGGGGGTGCKGATPTAPGCLMETIHCIVCHVANQRACSYDTRPGTIRIRTQNDCPLYCNLCLPIIIN